MATAVKSRARRERTLGSRRAFDGRLLKLDVLEVALADGRRARREIIRHPGAVAVLCRAADGRFVLVRQFRKAVEGQLLEAVAGTREPGESPRACARREVREETGFMVAKMARLGYIYSAPGFCSERLELFLAELAPARGRQNPDRDEALEVMQLARVTLVKMIARGKIKDAKTLAAWTLARARGFIN